MRAPSLPRRPFVLVLGLCLVGTAFLLLEPHVTKWRERAGRVERVVPKDPWTPPDLATSGIPADPTQALQALEVHGRVPDCHVSEHIEYHSGGDGDEDDHDHVYRSVEPLPRLAGHAEAILPYLGHPSEPVVFRAASLLCFIQDAQSERALQWLYNHYQCRGWVSMIVRGARVGVSRPEYCPPENEDGGYQLLSTPPSEGSKPSPEALVLAERISKGDVAAVHQALLATQDMELPRRSEGILALMNVSTPQGLALVFQALLDGWDAEVLKIRPGWSSSPTYWNGARFLEGMGGAALRSVVERTGRSEEAVLVEAVGLMPGSLVNPVQQLLREKQPLYYALGRLARSPTGREVTAAPARELLERIDRETAGNDPQEIEAESKRITALYRAKDVKALKQLVPSDRPDTFHAQLALCYLAGLGQEKFALPLLEKRAPLALHDTNAIRSEVKQLLDRAKPGATKERLQRIYEKMSLYCRLNDCVTESPR